MWFAYSWQLFLLLLTCYYNILHPQVLLSQPFLKFGFLYQVNFIRGLVNPFSSCSKTIITFTSFNCPRFQVIGLIYLPHYINFSRILVFFKCVATLQIHKCIVDIRLLLCPYTTQLSTTNQKYLQILPWPCKKKKKEKKSKNFFSIGLPNNPNIYENNTSL